MVLWSSTIFRCSPTILSVPTSQHPSNLSSVFLFFYFTGGFMSIIGLHACSSDRLCPNHFNRVSVTLFDLRLLLVLLIFDLVFQCHPTHHPSFVGHTIRHIHHLYHQLLIINYKLSWTTSSLGDGSVCFRCDRVLPNSRKSRSCQKSFVIRLGLLTF